MLLTIKEIAKQLQVPESNIRYYRDRFDEYIPSVGEGRRRRYKKEAVDVFAAIVQGYKEEKNTEQIASELAARYPRTVEVDRASEAGENRTQIIAAGQNQGAENTSHSLLQTQSRTLEHLAAALARKSSVTSELSSLRQEQERLKKGLVHVWRTQKTFLNAPGEKSEPQVSSLADHVHVLERRIQNLEQHVETELQEMRCEVKECLSLIRRVLEDQSHDD